jgi:virginiamycin B lyase
MKSGIIIGTTLALLTVIGASAVWVLKSPLTSAKQAQSIVQPQPYAVNRADEVPLATHREQSLVATENHTTQIPWGIALDNYHGFVWVAEPGCDPDTGCPPTTQGTLGQYALSDGTFITDFNEPIGYSSPLFAAVDNTGNVWFTQPTTHALGEFQPANETWNTWTLKKGSTPFDLIFDKLGNLWFTDPGTNSIGFFNTHTDTTNENPIPTPASSPYGITLDSHGTIWFAENSSGINQIGSFQPTPSGTIKITEYTVNGLRPHLITSDKAGNIWFSEGFSGYIGEFNPRNGTNIAFPAFGGTCASVGNCATGTHISGIYVDPSTGNIWFTDSLSQRVGYIIPSTGQVVTQTLPKSNAHPHDGLIIDNSNRVWFTSEFAQSLTMWPASSLK